MSQEKTMIPSSESAYTEGLKMVKNANIFQDNGIFFIRHYETIIFAYNPKNRIAEINWHCSTTSDRQIRRAIEFFGVDEENQIDVSDGIQKWRYSGELQN